MWRVTTESTVPKLVFVQCNCYCQKVDWGAFVWETEKQGQEGTFQILNRYSSLLRLKFSKILFWGIAKFLVIIIYDEISAVPFFFRLEFWVIPFLGIQKIHACKEPIYNELRHSIFTTTMDKTNDCFKTIGLIQKMVSFMQYHIVFRIFNVKEMLLCSANKWHQVRGRL